MSAFVFLPGMGCGSWAWQPVARRMAARDHSVLLLTLPGLGFTDDRSGHRMQAAVDYVVRAVASWAEGEPVTLVGHSWGGYPATGAAHGLGAKNVREVVYVNAVVPARGVALRDEDPGMAAAVDAQLVHGDTISASPQDVAQQMMHDETTTAQQIVSDLMVPTPIRYFTEALQTGPVTDLGIPARYILGDVDRALVRPGSEFAGRVGVQPEMIGGSHMSMFTNPEPVAAKLCESA